ncbi:MAG: hypothetical protein WDM92_08155 [Caulobacteraceae bacterium]
MEAVGGLRSWRNGLSRKRSRPCGWGAGEEFRGEAILAVTKALLQSGVAYIGGYQGAPISHLLDVFADASEVLEELGVHFESSASEASACAMLAASVNYPLRGAVAWKSVVGTNVASDALSSVASGGVTGGALIILGEDYGEGSSIMQERTHAFAMKSQVWLLDRARTCPRSWRWWRRASNCRKPPTPGDAGAAHPRLPPHGRFTAKDNVRPAFTAREALENPDARPEPHRPAARQLSARAGEGVAPLAGRRGLSSPATA